LNIPTIEIKKIRRVINSRIASRGSKPFTDEEILGLIERHTNPPTTAPVETKSMSYNIPITVNIIRTCLDGKITKCISTLIKMDICQECPKRDNCYIKDNRTEALDGVIINMEENHV
jgi:hypothetical protein